MSIMTESMKIENLVGRKTGNEEISKQSYSIYDSAFNCPLRVYISVVCDKNYKSLIKHGDVDDAVLESTFLNIMDEYADLCGSNGRNQKVQNYNAYKSQILAMDICLRLLSLGSVEKVVENLNKIGLRCSLPKNEEELKALGIKIDQRIKDRVLRLKKLSKELQDAKGKELEKKDFYEQLVSISRWAGFRISDEITLAEYAIFVKQAHLEAEKMKMDGKNGK